MLRHLAFSGPQASPPFDDVPQGHSQLHMHLEHWSPPCVLFDLWFSPWKLWEYWVIHILIPPVALQTSSAP